MNSFMRVWIRETLLSCRVRAAKVVPSAVRLPLVLTFSGATACSGYFLISKSSLFFSNRVKVANCSTSVKANTESDAEKVGDKSNAEAEESTMSRRQLRFEEFASCECNNQSVMTPQDFLDSLVENSPKYTRRGKVDLTDKEVKKILNKTPSISRGSTSLFRDLHNDGLITYSEYLFLVTILTKSQRGLKIALKMMDIDGDHRINKFEFQEIQRMINKTAAKAMFYIRTGYVKYLECKKGVSSTDCLEQTSLAAHLFGIKGKGEVTFDQFFRFMDNLQSEVLELEFHEFSKSMKCITELDFARILLRNTVLSPEEHRGYLNRLSERLSLHKGITLKQFKDFNQFLNNIDDFVIAMRMCGTVQAPVEQGAFQRAVRLSTGVEIDNHVTDVLFKLFDIDGDGKLSHVEFIDIMKDRLKRGFGKYPKLKGMKGFKHCLKKEMQGSS